MPKTLYIIDGHAHIYAAYFAPMRQRLTSPAGEPTNATYIFTTAVLGLIKNQKPDMLVVAMDSIAPTFRKEIYTEYKAHRPPMPDDMPVQIKRIEQILSAMNIPMLRVNGFEADSDDFVFDNQMLAQILWLGCTIAEVSCPTKYFPEASSINFSRSVKYGFGCLCTGLKFRLAKMNLIKSRLFPVRS